MEKNTVLNYIPGSEQDFHPYIRGFAQIAASMGVTVVSADMQLWEAVAYTARFVDASVDDQNATEADLNGFLATILQGSAVDGYHPDRAKDLQKICSQLPVSVQSLLLSSASAVVRFAASSNEARNGSELREIKKNEALVFATLFELLDRELGDEASRLNFNKFLRQFSVIGYYIDTVLDINADIDDGKHPNLTIDLSFRPSMLLASINELARTRHIWNGQSLLALCSMAMRNARR